VLKAITSRARGPARTESIMRLTIFTDYTLRVLIYLGARQREGGLATIGDVATAYGISENHLMKIVYHLARQGYVETTRGKGGGMRLARAPETINIGEVVRGAEEDLAVVECFEPGNFNCPIVPECELRRLLGRALNAFLGVLDGQTLADLVKPRAQLVRIFRDAAKRRARVPRIRRPAASVGRTRD
jgi:Rrf2 family nitric oxide-sensitive transcriptional repressor